MILIHQLVFCCLYSELPRVLCVSAQLLQGQLRLRQHIQHVRTCPQAQ